MVGSDDPFLLGQTAHFQGRTRQLVSGRVAVTTKFNRLTVGFFWYFGSIQNYPWLVRTEGSDLELGAMVKHFIRGELRS